MKLFRSITLLFLALLTTISIFASTQQKKLLLTGENLSYQLDPNTLRITLQTESGQLLLVSDGIESLEGTLLTHEPNAARIRSSKHDIDIEIEIDGDELCISLSSATPQTLNWPSYRVAKDSHFLWLLGDGRCVPLHDRQWADYLTGSHRVAASPFWGHFDQGLTLSWLSETPFREELEIDASKGRFAVEQTFLARFGIETHSFRFSATTGANPLFPAKRFRASLKSRGLFLTAEEKFAQLPEGSQDKLLGAIHAYLWGEGTVSKEDLHRNKYSEFAKMLLASPYWKSRYKPSLNDEDIQLTREVAQAQHVYPYLQRGFLLVVDKLVKATSPDDLYLEFEKLFQRSPKHWGQGLSKAMIDDLKDLGISRARIIAPSDILTPAIDKVARHAIAEGYLFGVYDSYESAHPESIAGTDSTWATAQLGQRLFETGTSQNEEGVFYTGYKGIGRRVNPLSVRSIMEERVSENLSNITMNSYFIDCDGVVSDIDDDYNPNYRASAETLVQERKDRLKWLRTEKQLLVGTEGTDPEILQQALVAEWGFSPPFFWEDPVFKDRESNHFIGNYWPPEEPAVFFKQIPLTQTFRERYFDPSSRVPLLQAVLHDSTIVTHHWGSDMFKYEGTQANLQLWQMLYLSPPLYNLNRERLAEKREFIKRNYDYFSPLHSEHGFDELSTFEWLSANRQIQKTTFSGGLEVIANFSQNAFQHDDIILPARSVVALLPDGTAQIFTP